MVKCAYNEHKCFVKLNVIIIKNDKTSERWKSPNGSDLDYKEGVTGLNNQYNEI